MAMIRVIEDAAEKVGGIRKLAEAMGIRHTSFYDWTQVPAERVLKFEEISGISRYKLRPDIYGEEPKKQ